MTKGSLVHAAVPHFAIGIALCFAGATTQLKVQKPAKPLPSIADIHETARQRTETVNWRPVLIGVGGEEALESKRTTGLLDLASVTTGIDFSRSGIANELAITFLDLGFSEGHVARYPNLGAPDRSPFYTIELRPGELSTLTGLDTDAKTWTIVVSIELIRDLYAFGVDMTSPSSLPNLGGGSGLRLTYAFGYATGRAISLAVTQIR